MRLKIIRSIPPSFNIGDGGTSIFGIDSVNNDRLPESGETVAQYEDFHLYMSLNESATDDLNPSGYDFNFLAMGFPETPPLDFEINATDSVEFLRQYLSDFPATGNPLDIETRPVVFESPGDIETVVNNAYDLFVMYKDSRIAPAIFSELPSLRCSVTRIENNGTRGLGIFLTPESIEIESDIFSPTLPDKNLYPWNLAPDATGILKVARPPALEIISHWNIPLEPVPPRVNSGYGVAFLSGYSGNSGIVPDYLLIAEYDDPPIKNTIGFSYPNESQNPTDFNRWSAPPLRQRIPFQNYARAVPSVFIKRRK